MFRIEAEQFAHLRKNALAKAIAESFEGSKQRGTIDPITGDVLATDPRGHSLRFGFDAQGYIGSVTSPLGRTWHLENGPRGRMEGLTAPSGLRLGLGYDREGRATSISQNEAKVLDFEYDVYGNLARIVYSDGTDTRFSYWGPGRLTEKVDRLGNIERYGYDDVGRLTSITDANGHTTEFEYSDWDRPGRARFPDGRVEIYSYDEQGRTTRIATKSGRVAELSYKGDGVQPVRIAYEDGEVCEFVYDDQGRTLEARNAEAVARYEYDSDGRVVKEDVNGKVVEYQYDETGSLVGLTYPSGDTVRFGYDPDLRLDWVEDWNGGVYRWGYDQADRVFAIRYPGGLTTHTWQAPTGQIEATDVLAPDGHRLFGSRYIYDIEGRLSRSVDSDLGQREYRYDKESQLVGVQADRPERNEHFAYDAAGNRIESSDETAEFDRGNRLLRQGETYCTYDIHGDLAVIQTSERNWRYTWNSRGMLVRAESSDGRVVTFGYDAFGRRLWKRATVPGEKDQQETRFHWAGEHMIGEETWEGNDLVRQQEYLYQPGTYVPLAGRGDGEVFYYHCDHLGTPRRITDGRSRLVWAAEHEAFGQAHVSVEEVWNPLRFPGQYFDEETDLNYNRFRYFSPKLGRYLTRDPLGYLSGLALYAYARNDSINDIDPSGLLSGWGKAILATGMTVFGVAAVVFAAPAVLAVAAGTAAFTASTVSSAALVVAGMAAFGAGVGLGIAPDGCLRCQKENMKKGALAGAGAALSIMGLAVSAVAGMFGGGGWALAGGGAMAASGAVPMAAAVTLTQGTVMMSRGRRTGRSRPSASREARTQSPIRNLRGKSLKWIRRQKPHGWQQKPAKGNGWKWIDENNIERLRFMRRQGSNPSNVRWSRQANGYFRWRDANGEFLDVDGNVVPRSHPEFHDKTHIVYEGPL